jgi:hypothetical protein
MKSNEAVSAGALNSSANKHAKANRAGTSIRNRKGEQPTASQHSERTNAAKAENQSGNTEEESKAAPV